MEDNKSESNTYCVEHSSKDFMGNNICLCSTGYLFETLSKNLVVFCSCPKNLTENKLESIRLISLEEEISKQNNVEAVTLLYTYTHPQ